MGRNVERRSVGAGRPGMARLALVLALLCIAAAVGLSTTAVVATPPLVLSEDERRWLRDHADQLILAPTPDFPPLEIIDEQGRFTGYAGDLFARVQELLGVRFKVVRLQNWDAIVQAGRRREIAMTSLAQRTPERDAFWQFTSVFLEVPTVMITGRTVKRNLTLDDLAGYKVGVVKSFAVTEYLKEKIPHTPLVVVDENSVGLRQVAVGDLDVLITELPSAVWMIEREGLTGLRVAGTTGFSYRYSIASRNDWPMLGRLLQRALDAIPEAERQAIYHRWIRLEAGGAVNIRVVATVGTVILAILLAVMLWNRSLRREVQRRTASLETTLAELRSHEQALSDSESRLRSIFEAATDGILVIDGGVITDCNPQVLRMFGGPREQIVGRHPAAFSPPRQPDGTSSAERAQAIDAEVLAGRPQRFAWTHVRLDGSTLAAEVSLSRLDLGGRGAIMAIVRDVTEARRLEAQLRQAQKMDVVGQLAGGIAHDFNNMLTGILGSAELLALKLPADSPLHEYTNTILEAARQAGDLTRKLLAFSRKAPMTLVPLDVREAVRAAMGLLEHAIDPAIRLEIQCHEGPATVSADQTLLQNAILNLGLNARDALRGGGVIRVTTAAASFDAQACTQHPFEIKPGPYVQIAVADTGSGMSAETVSRLFEPFFTTKEVGRGTGLGLAMVYGTVKDHAGAIEVESAPGRGSVFKMYLPLIDPAVVPAGVPAGTGAPLRRGRILLIEDEPLVRSTGALLLKRLGHDVVVAEDGEKGVAAFSAAAGRFDLVISDMVMPGLSGRQVGERIRAVAPTVRIIFCSGYHAEKTVAELLQMGNTTFLQKPYTLQELTHAVERALAAGD